MKKKVQIKGTGYRVWGKEEKSKEPSQIPATIISVDHVVSTSFLVGPSKDRSKALLIASTGEVYAFNPTDAETLILELKKAVRELET